MHLSTASEQHAGQRTNRPSGRLHAYAPGMIQTLCGWSLVGCVLPFERVSWGDNPDGLSQCRECANVASVL